MALFDRGLGAECFFGPSGVVLMGSSGLHQV